MKVVFLDIDGVLNSDASARRLGTFQTFAPECVAALNRILASTGACVVVSSTWRIGRMLTELRDILRNQGVLGAKVIDKTPYHGNRSDYARGHEIREWLSMAHRDPVSAFVVLDDDSDMDRIPSENFVQTDFAVGLTEADADRAIAILGGTR